MERWLILMHDDATRPEDGAAWEPYLDGLVESGALLGGSSLGSATSFRADHGAVGSPSPIVGYLLVQAASSDDVAGLLEGNPVLVAGGTVEVRPLIAD